ncbi:MAG: hypothetical protein ACYTHJ_18550, partial [Planctomycetota bacterium]
MAGSRLASWRRGFLFNVLSAGAVAVVVLFPLRRGLVRESLFSSWLDTGRVLGTVAYSIREHRIFKYREPIDHLGEYAYGSEWAARHGGQLPDGWGNPVRVMSIVDDRFDCRVISAGPNGVFQDGKGDDIYIDLARGIEPRWSEWSIQPRIDSLESVGYWLGLGLLLACYPFVLLLTSEVIRRRVRTLIGLLSLLGGTMVLVSWIVLPNSTVLGLPDAMYGQLLPGRGW